MQFQNSAEAENFIFSSYMRVSAELTGPDALTRLPALTRRLLDRLGRPDLHFTSILVTGSKGKGSIALLTAKLLEALGYRVGLITSPHISSFRERIRLNGRAISDADLVTYANRLEVPAREIFATLQGRQYLSPTGLILALAALYWVDQRVDFAVVEAGRGGRFDDCSVLDNPLALFGPVLLEHREKLGDTVAEIAASKTVLLKPGGVGISVPQSETVLPVMQSWAHQVGGQLMLVGRELQILVPRIKQDFLQLSVQGRVNLFDDLKLPIPALYEADNLAVALGAVEIVADERKLGPVRIEQFRHTLARLRWPGRMQIVSRAPFTLLDCTVTRESTRSVLDSLAGPGQLKLPVAVITGVPVDRDWQGVLDELNGRIDYLVISKVDNSRLNFPPEAYLYARRNFPPGCRIVEAPDFRTAYARIMASQPSPGSILILGTQSFIAQALLYFGDDLEQL